MNIHEIGLKIDELQIEFGIRPKAILLGPEEFISLKNDVSSLRIFDGMDRKFRIFGIRVKLKTKSGLDFQIKSESCSALIKRTV